MRCQGTLGAVLGALLLLGLVADAAPPANTPPIVIIAPASPTSLLGAWGHHVAIQQLATQLDAHYLLIFENAATPDGRFLVMGEQPRDFLTTHLPSYLVLYDLLAHQVRRIQALQQTTSQIQGASADAHWVVWSEVADSNGFDWRIFSFNRLTGQVQQIAQAARDASGQPYAGPAPYPCVDHDQVIWGQVIGPIASGDLHNAVVQRLDLASGSRSTLATKAGSPTCAWPWVAWAQSAATSGFEQLHNLQTGENLQVPTMAPAVALAGTSMAFNDGSLHQVQLLSDFRQSPQAPQTLIQGSNLQFVTIGPRLVAWDAMGAAQVWDRTLQRLVTLPLLPQTSVSATWVGGRSLIWYQGSILNIVDTATLPGG